MSKNSLSLSEFFSFMKSSREGQAVLPCNKFVVLLPALPACYKKIKNVGDKELSLGCHCCSNHFLCESEPMKECLGSRRPWVAGKEAMISL